MKLFPSTLVINNSPTDVLGLLATIGHPQIINNPDIFEVTEYNINTIRQITKFLANKPFSHSSKVILITDTDKLNTESQNALLKNLEEPGFDNYFILTTNRPFALLPTIISRCHQIYYQNAVTSKISPLVIPKTIENKLLMSQELASDRASTITYLEAQLSNLHSEFVTSPTLANSQLIKRILKTINLIKANIDPKTALDYLMLSITNR